MFSINHLSFNFRSQQFPLIPIFVPMGCGSGDVVDNTSGKVINSISDDMLFGFIFEDESLEKCWEEERDLGDDDDEMRFVTGMADEKSAFWESQRNLLQLSLSSKTALEMKVCRATEKVLTKIRSSSEGGGGLCSCSSSKTIGVGVGVGIGGECRSCLLRSVSEMLRHSGYDCGVCKSKWRRSVDIPSGEHTYLDVVQQTTTNKKKNTSRRVVIEINLKAEFEMARASVEYKSLVSNLPEVFVGKAEKLKAIIKIVCTAAKRWMKDSNMHMAPWRKYKYMQAKWLGSSADRLRSVPGEENCKMLSLVENESGGGRKVSMKESLLTFDLLQINLNCSTTAMEVL